LLTISVLSKHLPSVVTYIQTPIGDGLLELIYLIESSRYHLQNLEKLTSNKGSAPKNFQSGTDIRGSELDSHWRMMASWMEFEAFITSGKRALDRAWSCVADQLGNEVSEMRTLGSVIYKRKKSIKDPEMVNGLKSSHIFKCWKRIGMNGERNSLMSETILNITHLLAAGLPDTN